MNENRIKRNPSSNNAKKTDNQHMVNEERQVVHLNVERSNTVIVVDYISRWGVYGLWLWLELSWSWFYWSIQFVLIPTIVVLFAAQREKNIRKKIRQKEQLPDNFLIRFYPESYNWEYFLQFILVSSGTYILILPINSLWWAKALIYIFVFVVYGIYILLLYDRSPGKLISDQKDVQLGFIPEVEASGSKLSDNSKMSGNVVCSYCQTISPIEARTCEKCGAPLPVFVPGFTVTSKPLKNAVLRHISQICKGYERMDGSDLLETIPANKLRNARREFKIPEDETVIFVYDKTIVGTNKRGFAICETGIYWKNGPFIPTQRTYLEWDEFMKREIDIGPNNEILLGNGDAIDVYKSDSMETKQMLMDIREALRSVNHQ